MGTLKYPTKRWPLGRAARLQPILLAATALVMAVAMVSCTFQRYGITASAADETPTPALPAADFEVKGRIYFVQGDHIWRWSGGSAQQFSKDAKYESPRLSPDGRSLAAVQMGTNHSDLVLLNSNGQRTKQLTDNWSHTSVQDSAWARSPAWSPDGKSIAFVSDLRRYDMSIWQVPADGGTARLIFGFVVGSGGGDTPTWSPDGKKLAFTGTAGEVTQIYIIDLVTGQWRTITNLPDGAYDPAWSPSGDYVAYVAREGRDHNIWIARPDGSGARRVIAGGLNRAPTWSANDDLLTYLRLEGAGFDLFAARVFNSGKLAISQPRRLTNGMNIVASSGLSWRI